jgi:hypothetical protein
VIDAPLGSLRWSITTSRHIMAFQAVLRDRPGLRVRYDVKEEATT